MNLLRLMLWSPATLILLAVAGATAAAPAAETYTFHHEHVLGTSLELQIEADSLAAAQRAEERALREIDRLNAMLSTYQSDSEFSRWQQTREGEAALSPELYDLLAASERWQRLSDGAFNPAAEAATRVWQQAAKHDRLPNGAELAAVIAATNRPHWKLGKRPLASRVSTAPLSLNAIAKGAIVDFACRAARGDDQAIHGVLVNIGGDLRATGDTVRRVAIADPHNDADNAPPAAVIHVRNRGVATSGNYRRGFKIAGGHYSHIIDPRAARPVDHVASATVVAENAADADALATIFSVLEVAESQRLAKSLNNIDYYLITKDGQTFASEGWSELAEPQLFRFVAAQQEGAKAAAEVKAASGDKLLELVVNFEIAKQDKGRYRRPYVAVWLEDADEFPVRTAVLWMQTKDPGPRWHRDLLRWFRNDGVRKLADDKELIGVVSSATRGPGEYKAVFDGNDDHGKPLKPGKYTLFIEVAREHGTYQLIRHPLTLGAKPQEEVKLKSNVEVKSATVEYRAPQAANGK